MAILASLLFDESIGFVGGAGLVLGVIGLLLLKVNIDVPSCKCKMTPRVKNKLPRECLGKLR